MIKVIQYLHQLKAVPRTKHDAPEYPKMSQDLEIIKMFKATNQVTEKQKY